MLGNTWTTLGLPAYMMWHHAIWQKVNYYFVERTVFILLEDRFGDCLRNVSKRLLQHTVSQELSGCPCANPKESSPYFPQSCSCNIHFNIICTPVSRSSYVPMRAMCCSLSLCTDSAERLVKIPLVVPCLCLCIRGVSNIFEGPSIFSS